MNNPFGNFNQREPALGADGLQELCKKLNSARAERAIPQHYLIVKKGGVETLQIVSPDCDPVPYDELGNRPKVGDYRLTQAQVDRIVADRGREMSIARDRGLIHKTEDGRYVPA